MILNEIDFLIFEAEEKPFNNKKWLPLAAIGLIGVKFVKFLKFIKFAKSNGVIIIDPKTEIKNEFQENVRLAFLIAIKSIAISTVLNQILNMLLSDASQETINKIHIKVAAELFTTSILAVITMNVVAQIKAKNGGNPLTRNEIGIIVTTVLGMTLFTFLELLDKQDFPQSTLSSIWMSIFLTFIINTSYVTDMLGSMIRYTRSKLGTNNKYAK